MKTLILNGSPRKNGDTASLLKRLTAGLEGEYMLLNAYDDGISPCVDCRRCWEMPGCAIQDGMQAVYDYIEECDNVVIASPIYFSELTGKLLDVASRFQTYYCARAFRKEEPAIKPKKGAVILVGGGDGGFGWAHATAKVLLSQLNCREDHLLVANHNTNRVPAIEDAATLQAVDDMIRYLNGR